MRVENARGWAGLIFALAFAIALLADVLFPQTAQLTEFHYTAFGTVLFALFGIELARSRWGQAASMLGGAISGALAARDQEDADD
ncbi:hypothetical protein [Haloferax sp. ATB1]|uniref:hypothetical protein n=1 Tax=Haloferax sp. ATB1 TaxID=1508454 RepID=UPI0005B1F33B|nr:hypothetical protein [Haloferax sp. ATB1]